MSRSIILFAIVLVFALVAVAADPAPVDPVKAAEAEIAKITAQKEIAESDVLRIEQNKTTHDAKVADLKSEVAARKQAKIDAEKAEEKRQAELKAKVAALRLE